MYREIIFVCTENTCLSPMAEAIYDSLRMEGTPLSCSRGMVVLFPEPMNPKAELALENHGITMTKEESAQFRPEEAGEGVLVLAMTEKVRAQLADRIGADKVQTLKEFSGETGDVLDPYGGTLVDYEACYNELLRLIKKVLYRLPDSAG